MGRKKTDTVEYFPHDTNAASKRTLWLMMDEFGVAGYAFWFLLLEWLGGSCEEYYFDVNEPVMMELLCRKCGSDLVSGSKMLAKLAKYEAIDPILWEHGVIWSQNFVDRLVAVYKTRRRNPPEKPFRCDDSCGHLTALTHKKTQRNTDHLPLDGDFLRENADFLRENATKESKVKESKVNNNITIPKVVVEGVRGRPDENLSAAASFFELPPDDLTDDADAPAEVNAPGAMGNSLPAMRGQPEVQGEAPALRKIGYSKADSAKETFEQYREKLREEFADLPDAFWAEEMAKFGLFFEKKPPKNPKLALRNWAVQAREIYHDRRKTAATGPPRGGNGQEPPDPDKFVRGKYGGLVRR